MEKYLRKGIGYDDVENGVRLNVGREDISNIGNFLQGHEGIRKRTMWIANRRFSKLPKHIWRNNQGKYLSSSKMMNMLG